MLFKRAIKTVRFVGMTRRVYAQGIIDIKLPCAFGKGRFGVFARQFKQVLVAPNHSSRPHENRAKDRMVKHLVYAAKEHPHIALDIFTRGRISLNTSKTTRNQTGHIPCGDNSRHRIHHLVNFG